jgi:hypothetical protein
MAKGFKISKSHQFLKKPVQFNDGHGIERQAGPSRDTEFLRKARTYGTNGLKGKVGHAPRSAIGTGVAFF